MMVRTDGSGNVLKNFVVGVDASGANDGQFVINDPRIARFAEEEGSMDGWKLPRKLRQKMRWKRQSGVS